MQNWNAIQANFRQIDNSINKNLSVVNAILHLMWCNGHLAAACMVKDDADDLMILRTLETSISMFAFAVVALANAANVEIEQAVGYAKTVVNFDKTEHSTQQYIYRLASIILELTKKLPQEEHEINIGLLIIYLERISLKNNLEFAKLVAA